MSEHARSFVAYLSSLAERDRGAMAHLRRSLGFAPGTYPQAYPYVERFVGPDRHADDPWRRALYVTAGLYAFHPQHRQGQSFATAFGRMARQRDRLQQLGSETKRGSMEQRFVALLGAESESLPVFLRQGVSLLASDSCPCDYVRLLDDLARWLNALDVRSRDALRQAWARDFYAAYDTAPKLDDNADSSASDTQPAP